MQLATGASRVKCVKHATSYFSDLATILL
jgi:hypothetical protein